MIWGARWDPLLARDNEGLLQRAHDGDASTASTRPSSRSDGAYVREHFFGAYPELRAMVADMVRRRDLGASTAAATTRARSTRPTSAAMHHKGQPTVILAKTIKGYGMGAAGEGQNITHQQKKMNEDALLRLPRPLRACR